jgi:hypothetical protein
LPRAAGQRKSVFQEAGNPINNKYSHCFATTSLIESAVKFDTWEEARKVTEDFKEFDYGTEIIIRKISV